MAIAVGIVTKCARIMIRIVPYGPIVPTENPNRRNRMAPRIVAMLVKNTDAVPNDFLFCCIKKLIYSFKVKPGLKVRKIHRIHKFFRLINSSCHLLFNRTHITWI